MLRQQFYSLPQPDPKEFVVSSDPSNIFPAWTLREYYSNSCFLKTVEVTFMQIRVAYPLLRNEFILTQGPLPRTVPEFWRMIWQEKVETIIMLCRTVENGKRKCAEYFSSHPNIPLSCVNGKLTVFLRSRCQENDLLVSTLELKYLAYSRTISHYQWIEWPDCQ
ncbi:Protein-tyrosine phosphatase, partial [Ostertagia ostertagi]